MRIGLTVLLILILAATALGQVPYGNGIPVGGSGSYLSGFNSGVVVGTSSGIAAVAAVSPSSASITASGVSADKVASGYSSGVVVGTASGYSAGNVAGVTAGLSTTALTSYRCGVNPALNLTGSTMATPSTAGAQAWYIDRLPLEATVSYCYVTWANSQTISLKDLTVAGQNLDQSNCSRLVLAVMVGPGEPLIYKAYGAAGSPAYFVASDGNTLINSGSTAAWIDLTSQLPATSPSNVTMTTSFSAGNFQVTLPYLANNAYWTYQYAVIIASSSTAAGHLPGLVMTTSGATGPNNGLFVQVSGSNVTSGSTSLNNGYTAGHFPHPYCGGFAMQLGFRAMSKILQPEVASQYSAGNACGTYWMPRKASGVEWTHITKWSSLVTPNQVYSASTSYQINFMSLTSSGETTVASLTLSLGPAIVSDPSYADSITFAGATGVLTMVTSAAATQAAPYLDLWICWNLTNGTADVWWCNKGSGQGPMGTSDLRYYSLAASVNGGVPFTVGDWQYLQVFSSGTYTPQILTDDNPVALMGDSQTAGISTTNAGPGYGYSKAYRLGTIYQYFTQSRDVIAGGIPGSCVVNNSQMGVSSMMSSWRGPMFATASNVLFCMQGAINDIQPSVTVSSVTPSQIAACYMALTQSALAVGNGVLLIGTTPIDASFNSIGVATALSYNSSVSLVNAAVRSVAEQNNVGFYSPFNFVCSISGKSTTAPGFLTGLTPDGVHLGSGVANDLGSGMTTQNVAGSICQRAAQAYDKQLRLGQ